MDAGGKQVALAAYLPHLPFLGDDLFSKVVLLLLQGGRFQYQLLQLLDGGAAAQWALEVDFIVVQEARSQAAVSGEAEAVTLGAEALGHSADKAECPGGFR